MSSRSSQADPQQAAAQASEAFANMGAAGMDLFQEWLKAAGNAMPSMGGQAAAAAGQAASGKPLGNLGTMGGWSLPTMDPQELDKRIQDLKTVQFWLEQNARMIGMTIQTLARDNPALFADRVAGSQFGHMRITRKVRQWCDSGW